MEARKDNCTQVATGFFVLGFTFCAYKQHIRPIQIKRYTKHAGNYGTARCVSFNRDRQPFLLVLRCDIPTIILCNALPKPIVDLYVLILAIKEIIRTGDSKGWERIIDDTESMLTLWKDKERCRNLFGELLRVQSKFASHPEQFISYSSLEEAALGCIRILGDKTNTTLDEPFVLR